MLWSIKTIQLVNLFSLIELIKIFSSQDDGLTLDTTNGDGSKLVCSRIGFIFEALYH